MHRVSSRVADGAIPVVDVAALRDGSDPLRVARELHAASTGPGFVYVGGHGISDALVERARTAALDFFGAPPETKRTVAVAGSHRGWLALGGARMDDDVAADLKESFVWGLETVPDDHPLRGANRWPEAMPALRETATAWFDAADALARDLLRGFAIGLGRPEDTFLRRASKPLSRASFVWYPPQEDARGGGASRDGAAGERFGVAPHTDFGVLTVLAQDDVGGLEVERADKTWIEAPPIDGTLVVNVADLLSRWTDGIYRSTPHRVVNRSGRERLSLVLAFDPDPDTPIDPRDVLGERPGLAPPIRCGDYLERRFARAFAYRGRDSTSSRESA